MNKRKQTTRRIAGGASYSQGGSLVHAAKWIGPHGKPESQHMVSCFVDSMARSSDPSLVQASVGDCNPADFGVAYTAPLGRIRNKGSRSSMNRRKVQGAESSALGVKPTNTRWRDESATWTGRAPVALRTRKSNKPRLVAR